MEKKLKILMLEDVEDDAKLIERTLKKAGILFLSKLVDTKKEYTDAIRSFSPDIILSDHGLPQFNSTEALKICLDQHLKIPFILVTGTVSEEFAVGILKQGAYDYILKNNLSRLPLAIQNALKQKKTEEKRKKAEESLVNRNMELIKINKELDRFVYSASHDLRAPLKSILGLVLLGQLDLERKQYDGFDQYFKLIDKSIHKLDLTIKDIINYSRNTRTDIGKEVIDLKSLINEVIENLKYIESTEDIEKQIDIHQEALLISDPARLSIILNNLISNAIKFRDTGKENSFISIKVIVEKTKASISIKDNGIGIHEKYMTRIFDMFFRGTEKSDGSGLGLYIVKETLDKLKGTINVSSKPSCETEFNIELPNFQEK